MRPATFRRLLNLWPPLLCAGIRIDRIAPDFRCVEVSLRDRFYNRNPNGAHYGGSLFSMTDPFFALMLRHALGRGYVIWDKSAAIDFVLPGRGTVTARFVLEDHDLEAVRSRAETGAKVLHDFTATIVNAEGRTVATVAKTVYVRRKRREGERGEDERPGPTA